VIRWIGWGLIALPIVFFGFSYFLYPLILWLVSRVRPAARQWEDPPEWPRISVALPAYNEARSIRCTLENLLATDYPADRRQILVVSDASTDETDDIVREFAGQGVELLRMPERSGKTAAENAATLRLTGEIIVNTDATIRILPDSLKPLIRVFQDPAVGVASGRDLSVGDIAAEANKGESGYVGYEMWVRALETRCGGIVGASGCYYAIRHHLQTTLFPAALSRDFASALISREHGLRAVSVDEAVCLVPRAISLNAEFRRKVRTMARGLETLWYKRQLMNPFRYGGFALRLISHKLARWLVFLAMPGLLLGLGLLASHSWIALGVLVVALLGCLAGALVMQISDRRRVSRALAFLGFGFAACVAGILAWSKALRGERNPIWEPTRRPS
jgi:cellulose synthase/poly-beta-1,6-N-acetylglucosamine synthase-like glycosyltransferase